MSGLLVVLSLLATYRLTRLVTGDYITETPRKWLQKRLPEKLAYLIGCPWCASFWIALPCAWVTVDVINPAEHRWYWFAVIALAGSAVAGQLSNLEHVEDLGTLDEGDDDEGSEEDVPDAGSEES